MKELTYKKLYDKLYQLNVMLGTINDEYEDEAPAKEEIKELADLACEAFHLLENGIEKSDKYKVKSCTMTCSACPSQWDIYTTDGRYIYARYRWGYLSVTLEDEGVIVYEGSYGNSMDGMMSTSELAHLTKHVLDWSNIFGDNDE